MFTPAEQRRLFDRSKELLKLPPAEGLEAATAEVAELNQLLPYHEWRYSVLNDPVVSDFEYDSLYKR
ncbi:MAG: hypothetical protein AAFV25_19015, partial [Bacteroidota bacterium]